MKHGTHRIIPVVSSVLSVAALIFMTDDERYVAAPGLACMVMVLWLWMTLWHRDQEIPFFDVGVFCAVATLVYTVYPLVNYWMNDLGFDYLSDNRLQQFHISPAELGFFHLRHVVYLFSFVVFYSVFRGRSTIELGNVSTPSNSARQTIIFGFLLLAGYFYLLQIITGYDVNSTHESEAYAGNFAAVLGLPLFILQITAKFVGIWFVFKLALLFIVVSRCRQKKWRYILLLWIAAETVQTVYVKGSRGNLVLIVMATALLYHRMIKPLTIKFLLTVGIPLFVLFNFLGLYRAYFDYSSLEADLSRTDTGIFSGSNEFQALLGTAYDVHRLKEAGVDFPWYLYMNDFITILPPQQLMPFEKVAASEWYLREIGISKTGQGFMWGVISQSIAGYDWLELALRGAILGYILAKYHRWYVKHKSGFLETLFYAFFCIKVYYTFRDTTGSLLANLVWEIIPFYILLRLGVALLSQFRSSTPAIRIAMSPRGLK